LFLDVWKLLITTRHQEYGTGIMIVPILALAKVFLGIYYNLSIWYKLTDKNLYGALITILGAVITIVINILLIPRIGYVGSAIATIACYLIMMIVSYKLGQKFYPIPYAWRKLIGYITIAVLLFGIHQMVRTYVSSMIVVHCAGLVLLGIYMLFIGKIEKKEFSRLPVLSRLYFKPAPTPVASDVMKD
jgi:O-antigen/teichoic acid export membrane protein